MKKIGLIFLLITSVCFGYGSGGRWDFGWRGIRYVNSGESIQAKVNSISNADVNNPYLVKVAPGTYSEQVELPDYVSLMGSGRGVTVVTSDYPGDGANLEAVVEPGEDSVISNMTIEVTTRGAGSAEAGTMCGVADDDPQEAGSWQLLRCDIKGREVGIGAFNRNSANEEFVTIEDCNITSDLIGLDIATMNGAHKVVVKNCYINVLTQDLVETTVSCGFFCGKDEDVNSVATELNIYDCTIEVEDVCDISEREVAGLYVRDSGVGSPNDYVVNVFDTTFSIKRSPEALAQSYGIKTDDDSGIKIYLYDSIIRPLDYSQPLTYFFGLVSYTATVKSHNTICDDIQERGVTALTGLAYDDSVFIKTITGANGVFRDFLLGDKIGLGGTNITESNSTVVFVDTTNYAYIKAGDIGSGDSADVVCVRLARLVDGESGSVLTNKGSNTQYDFYLPPAIVGLQYEIWDIDNSAGLDVNIRADGSDNIIGDADEVLTADDDVQQFVLLKCLSNGEWQIVSSSGTWD